MSPEREPHCLTGLLNAAQRRSYRSLIWHGERDRNDPAAMARLQEQRLPHVKAVYYPEDGHMILYSRIGEILPELLAP